MFSYRYVTSVLEPDYSSNLIAKALLRTTNLLLISFSVTVILFVVPHFDVTDS